MVNGIPVGTSGPPPVYTPPKEAHVLNDAILRAALDLSKRDRTRRKVIFVISDGRELGSRASYSDVLHLLETHGIQVKAVVLDMGALPIYKQVEKLPHVFRHGAEVGAFAPHPPDGLEVKEIIVERYVGRHPVVAESNVPALFDERQETTLFWLQAL